MPQTDEHRLREPFVPIPHAGTNTVYAIRYTAYTTVFALFQGAIVKLCLKETAVERRKHVYAIIQYSFCGQIVLAAVMV